MTPYQYAKRYGVDRRSLNRYLETGRVCGAKRSGETWDIPEDALIKASPRRKKKRTVEDVEWDILTAAYRAYFFDAETLLAQRVSFDDAITQLETAGLIAKSSRSCDGVTSSGYAITHKGIQYAKGKKGEFIDGFVRRLGMVAGEITASVISA